MIGTSDEPLPARIIVQVINFLSPEILSLNAYRVSGRLPESTFPIGSRRRVQGVSETSRQVLIAEVAQ